MPKLLLNKTNIDAKAKPSPKGDVLYWDTGMKGFGVRVTPKGVTTFIAQARVRDSMTDRRVTVGLYGDYTVEEARELAFEQLKAMRRGVDPVQAKKERKAEAVTLREVMENYVNLPGKLKPTTVREYRRTVEVTLAKWADLQIGNISREMVLMRHQQIADHGLEGKTRNPGKGAPSSANSAMVCLRKLLNYAMGRYRRADGSPFITSNPVDAMSEAGHWRKDNDRSKRSIPDDLVGEAWHQLEAMRYTARNADALTAIDLVMLALLTGARKNELAQLKWSSLNIQGDNPQNWYFHLANPKNGAEVFLPLSRQARTKIEQRLSIKDANGSESPFVFPSRSKLGFITDSRAPLELVSKVAGKHLTIHDMRRTYTGLALRVCRIEKFRVDLLTNHQPPKNDTTIRNYFDCSNLKWLHAETQTISDHIEAQARIAAARASGANIVALHQTA